MDMSKKMEELMMATVVENGYRRTPARRAILATLAKSGGHITADDLATRVRAAFPSVGRMTVYRTLDLLCELGMLRPIHQGTGAAHYVFLSQGSHHHLICNRCGKTIEFDHCESGAISQALSERYNFEIQAHLLEFFGLCQRCKDTEGGGKAGGK